MRYYLESDGRVFVIDRDGTLDLPHREEISFGFDDIGRLAANEPVLFCVPRLTRFPHQWPGKDELASCDNASTLLRQAIHASMPRVVVEGIVIERGEILLVKGSRGLIKGRWSLPGGFLRFGEDPQSGLLREIREELRVEGQVESLITVEARLGDKSLLHWIMFFYRASVAGQVNPDPDEIAEARFFPLKHAADLVADGLMRQVVAVVATEAASRS
jgi:ADP-ribose pyrophosphatase YjhB (NUDIX family)